MAKRTICGTCGGGRAQHQQDDDGCWCPTCLRKDAVRCQEFVEAKVGSKAKVETPTVAVHHDPVPTSKAAAHRAKVKAGTFRQRVLLTIREAGEQGCTDDELEKLLGRSHQSVSACRNTLMKDALIVDSGMKRRTQWGNAAIVWKAAKYQ